MDHGQLLFSELRLVAIPEPSGTADDASLLKAVTANEELNNLGYTLSAGDVMKLARSGELDGFVERIRGYIGDVKAEPMYPGFPEQVMAMDEATFRFHQLLHYFTTYGFEELFDWKVSRGWLPDRRTLSRPEKDEQLLSAKVIELIDEADMYTLPCKKILSRTERMDSKQKMLILACIEHLTADELSRFNVTFKQNLLDLFNAIFTAEGLTSERKLECLHSICQHTGDVWKCMDYALTRAGFHFRTSQKRLIVKLLESYPAADFKGNLLLSNKKGERTSLMLRFLDYNIYSRSPEHKQAVDDFRSGKLRSWESVAKELVSKNDPEAVGYYAKRPGMMIRHLTYLLRNGYTAKDIYDALAPSASSLRTQTLVSLKNFFSDPMNFVDSDSKTEEATVVSLMVGSLLEKRLAANSCKLNGKKVYIDMPDFDIDFSSIRTGDKSDEGGYIRSGLAYRIPDAAKRIRFFIYWNDKERVDVDLHASAVLTDGTVSNIGWNSNFKDGALVFSGDITHSDAAEYIDIDFDIARHDIDSVSVNINLFSGKPCFKDIEECYVGAMAVSKTGEEIALYDPKNCFFTHYLTSSARMLKYGFVDVLNKVIIFEGLPGNNYYYEKTNRRAGFTLREYLDLLFRAQNVTEAGSREEADVVLVMGKPAENSEISLIDNGFFME
ncbi:MAG: hypothetical protein IKP47_01125 [Ruminococcus sp.]|nr:hypothetical protein [Ruminococcus sp.]